MTINRRKQWNLSCCIVKQLHQAFACTQERIACRQATHVVVDTVEFPTLATYSRNNSTAETRLYSIKKPFHRSINAIFGTVGRIATEEVILHLS